MTKNAKTWQVIAFNHAERSPLIDEELNCNVCQLENMYSLISDQTFIFQRLQWNQHQAELTQAELTQGRLDSRTDLTSGRVDPLPYKVDLERTAAKATGGGGLKCILPVPNIRPRLILLLL